MKLRPVTQWRIVAAALWVISLFCFTTAAGEGLLYYAPHHGPGMVAIQHLAHVWEWVGLSIQAVAVGVLSCGISLQKAVLRIFGSLAIVIAADSVPLLLVFLLIR